MAQPELYSTGVQLPQPMIEALDDIAEEHDTTRSAVIRAAIDLGLRAPKYDDTFQLEPESHERYTVADLARQGRLHS